MKILIVRTFPDILDTTKYNVQEIGLAKALTRAGHEVGIVLYNGKNDDKTEQMPVCCGGEEKVITIYRLHGWKFLKNGFFPSLKKISKKYDLIQVHEYDQITSWLYYAWNKKQKIVIYHGPYYHPFNKGYNLKCKVFDCTFLKLKHNKNVTCFTKSHAAADFLRKKGFKNVTAIGVGLDTENFQKVPLHNKESIPINSDRFNLLYVGKIEERRNSLFLLEVIKKVTDKNPHIQCIVIGNGEESYKEQFMQKAASLLANGRLIYMESASQTQLAELYQKVQLMVFPSNYDIFGMVLLEAVYFGLPIVSSKNGGADMLIQDGVNGIIVSEFSVDNWVDAIEMVCEDKKLRQSYCDKLKSQDVSWDQIAKKYESFGK